MSINLDNSLSRREFLGTAALAGTGVLLGLQSNSLAAEPPPETTKIKLGRGPTACWAPIHLADELLRGEGFTDVQHVSGSRQTDPETGKMLASGEADIGMGFVGPRVLSLDVGEPIVILAGVHVGCFELFGADQVRSIRDLKGKRVAVSRIGGPSYIARLHHSGQSGSGPPQGHQLGDATEADSVRLLAAEKD